MRRYLGCALLALLAACSRGEERSGPEEFTGTLELSAPAHGVHVNGSFAVRLRTEPEASRIDLFVDGVGEARLLWPYKYELDSRNLTEGPHELTAVAYFEADGVSHRLERSVRFTVDRTPPAITSRSPAPGEPVTQACGILVELSEPLAPGSLVATLQDGSGTLLPMTIEPRGDRAVRIVPGAPIEPPSTWTVSLAARDLAGNTLGPVSWTLQFPRLVERTLPDSPGMHELAIARNGSDVVLAYQVSRPGEGSSLAFGSLCQKTPLAVVEAHAGAVALATGPDGQAYAAHNGIHVHALGSGVWGEPAARVPYTSWIWDMRFGIGANGTMALGWRPQQESRCQRAGRVVAGVGEELPGLPCGPEGGLATSPAAAVDGTGRPVFAWLERTAEGAASVRVVAWDTTGWTALGDPMPGTGYEPPVLGIDAQGRPLLAYASPTFDGVLVKAWNGSAWSDLPRAATTGWAFPRQLALSGSTLFLVWEQGRSGGGFEITVSALRAGDSAWRKDAGPFPVLGPSHWGDVRLAMGPAGWSALAWADPADNGRYVIRTVWRNGSSH